jgi:quercetin dioxygenase-like cupin family protein
MRRLPCLLLLLLAGSAGAEPAGAPVILDPSTAKFQVLPVVPACFETALLRGDPSQAPSAILVRAERECTVPLHWHTPNESLVMISGTATVAMKGGPTATLGPGAYAYLPSRHPHVFSCTGPCLLFIDQDAPFDIHYVDADGREVAVEEALKAAPR